jgi:hypothetical protein
MPKEVIDISECVYCQNNESEYPEYAEGYKLISSTHSVGFAVDIHHYQLMPPEFHIAQRDQQDIVYDEYNCCSKHYWDITYAQDVLINFLGVFTRQ